jgi:hypothetical protein
MITPKIHGKSNIDSILQKDEKQDLHPKPKEISRNAAYPH